MKRRLGVCGWAVCACAAVLSVRCFAATGPIYVDLPAGAGPGATFTVDGYLGSSDNRKWGQMIHDTGSTSPWWPKTNPAQDAACTASSKGPRDTYNPGGIQGQWTWPARAAMAVRLWYSNGAVVDGVAILETDVVGDDSVAGLEEPSLIEHLYAVPHVYRVTSGTVPASATIKKADLTAATCGLLVGWSQSGNNNMWYTASAYGRQAKLPSGVPVIPGATGCEVTAHDVSIRTGAGETQIASAKVVLKCDSGASVVARAYGLGADGGLDFGSKDVMGTITIKDQDATHSGVSVNVKAGRQEDLGVKIETTASESSGGNKYSATAIVVITPS